jgi:hypothetical protein
MDKNIKEAMDIKQKRIENAIDRKERGIAYFNSLNSAIAYCKQGTSIEEVLKIRDRFYQEWKNWYAINVLNEQIGDEVDLPLEK